MCENNDLPIKRAKLDSSQTPGIPDKWHIKAILVDELLQPTERCEVIVSKISDRRCISQILVEICRLCPLSQLNHLKRVYNSKIIVCSVLALKQFINCKQDNSLNLQSLQSLNQDTLPLNVTDYLKSHNMSRESIDLLCGHLEIVSVASVIPILRWQYEDAMSRWPSKFHPNKQLERLYAGEMFAPHEYKFHSTIMSVCRSMAIALHKESCAIAVDPRTHSIVAIGFDEVQRHPLMHSAMVLIDRVARTQDGGAWNQLFDVDQEIYGTDDDCYSSDSCAEIWTKKTFVGVSNTLRKLINEKFPALDFGSERPRIYDDVEKKRLEDLDAAEGCADNLVKYGPYLCTGYDIYLTREPCIMCAMALTHSRIRNIFFADKQNNGALCSLTKLQSKKALNHHFQVYHTELIS